MHSKIMSPLRIEAIDNYHPAWVTVLETISGLNKTHELNLDVDGWLPARQVLLAGFFQTSVAGFICFSILPKMQGGEVELHAHMESVGVVQQFADAGLDHELIRAAWQHAKQLRCKDVVVAAA